MKCLLTIVCSLSFFAVPAFADEPAAKSGAVGNASPSTAKAWSHESSDIRPDSRVVWGKLENGLRYAILPTKAAPTRASLRMLVLAGSGMEDDDQQGMAHFLEHMAFNGTKHFPAGETFEYFQRLGMAFGAHTNATTEVDHTSYELELPRANEQLTRDGFRLFRDFLDGMLLDQHEIDKERGVVLSEQLARNTAGYRSTIAHLKHALAGTKFEDRMPIGKTETIRKLTRDRFVDFYETWYTPGRTVIVAVGDFDTAMIEREIRAQFADAKASRGETADPPRGKHVAGERLTARVNPIADGSSAVITLCTIESGERTTQTMAEQKADILDLLVNRMLSKRLDKLTELEGSPIQAAVIGNQRLYNIVERNYLSAECRPEQWAAAVAMLESEYRRALMHGFTADEVEAVKSDLTNMFQAIIATAETRQPDSLADELVKEIVDHGVFAHPATFAPLIAEFVPQVKRSDCDRQLHNRWDIKDLEISLSGNVALGDQPVEQLLAAYTASGKKPVAAPVDDVAGKFAFTDFGPAGEIVSRSEQTDLGIVQAQFANHVRVNIKSTTFEKNRVRVCVRFGGGLFELPADKPGLQHFAGEAFISGGLKGISLNELNRQLSGKNTSVMFAVGDDAFQIGGSCLTDSLELELQVCAAYLAAPGYRHETEQQFYDSMDANYAQRAHTAEGVLAYDGNAFLRSDDYRFTFPAKEQLRRLKLDDVKAWLAKPLAEGYLEVTVVGDVEPDAALKLLSTTLGALPSREKTKPSFASARKQTFPTNEKSKELRFESDMPRAVSAVCWPVPGAADVSNYRRMTVLKQIVNDRLRLKVREELGATYTPITSYYSMDAYPDYGYLAAQLVVDPKRLKEIGPLVTSVAADLASGSISDDEFTRAIQPIINGIDAQRRENTYWLSGICDSQERPASLIEIRSRVAEYASMTKGDVEQLAKQYLTAEHAVVLTVAPTAAAK